MLHVACLILVSRVLVAKVDHAVVVTDGEVCAVNIEPLAELVLIVKTVLSDLHLNTCSLVLNVKALVEVAHLV